MCQERLNGLELLYSHRDIDLDVNIIISKFTRKHKSRLEIVDIFNSDD